MARLSVDRALKKTNKHACKGEIEEARKLYNAVLQVFPKNQHARQRLAQLDQAKLPQEIFNKLIALYNQGQLAMVVEQAEKLIPIIYSNWYNIADAQLISLHKGEGETQLKKAAFDVTPLDAYFDAGEDAFLDTAAVMMNCNLIITSDTSVAHLAGALGCRTWVLLKHIPDWRWFLDRSDSPWYPSITLYRQKSYGDWQGVFAEIEHDLRALIHEGGLVT